MPERGSKMKVAPLVPFWQTTDGETCRLYHGHVTDVLARLPAASVQCVVTSPPYWGLRDYGVEGQLGSEKSPDCGTLGQAQCGTCFVCNMVAVFRGVRRVLRDDGTLWLNLGDSYGGASGRSDSGREIAGVKTNNKHDGTRVPNVTNLPSGNLVGIPWRVALALQADGWILRQDVVWHKPAPMPESVRNRCTKAHEYVFLLTKRMGYYFDQEAIKEKADTPGLMRTYSNPKKLGRYAFGKSPSIGSNEFPGSPNVETVSTRNKRSVWTVDDHAALAEWLADKAPEIMSLFLTEKGKGDVWRVSSQGYPGSHFATFPEALIEPMILAGTSEKGACTECGAPWRRVIEKTGGPPKGNHRDREDFHQTKYNEGAHPDGVLTGGSLSSVYAKYGYPETKTVGWEPTCECKTDETVPCVVLDPFIGSGTTCCVAIQLERQGWGIDLSETYLTKNARVRIEGTLYSYNLRNLIPRKGK